MHSTWTDDELMHQMAADPVAFDALFLRHWRAVFNYIGRMVGDRDCAEDLTQECFLRVWRARYSYRPSAKFRAWLFTIARRLALNELARRRSHPTLLTVDMDSEEQQPLPPAAAAVLNTMDPEGIIVARELAHTIERAIDALPAELREVLTLREIEDMSYDQMADIIGCPLGTVKSRLNAARQRLQGAALEWLGDTQI